MNVGFLHTAQAHVAVFEELVQSHSSEPITVQHEVRPELLAAAMAGEDVKADALVAVESLIDAGSTQIACTCSTLGGLLENEVVRERLVQRIDRAAADELMDASRILVLAAIESAAQAADQLLEQSARQTGSDSQWLVTLVPNAWDLFQSGNVQAYAEAVASYANQLGANFDAVFLAQASMLTAMDLCEHDRVVATPGPGVRRLLAKG